MKKEGFIYIIKNSINNKVYIGQTTQGVNVRFKQHLKCLKSNRKQLICKAILKYGKDVFYCETLECCQISELNDREQYYISIFQSNISGYNLSAGGNQSRRPKLNLDVQLITNMYENGKSQREIANSLNVTHKTIGNVLKNENINVRKRSFKLTKYNKIDKEELKKLLSQGLTFEQIAKELKVNWSSVRKAVIRHNLQNIIVKN